MEEIISGPYKAKKRKRKHPLSKKVPHKHAYLAILYVLFAALTLIWATTQVANGEALQSLPVLIKPVEAKEPAPTPNKPTVKPSGSTKAVEVSCYTGIESHGANGRNPWSVATYRYPQGTKLYIEGFGNKVVETVTSKTYSHRIDVWFGETQEDYDRCIKFGTKKLLVNILQ